MGCDVIATVDPSDPESAWDNYQCKHLDHGLQPGDVWIEFGKVCYYTFVGEFDLPRRYRFVSPRGVGTKLSRLLKKPSELKLQLLKEWGAQCSSAIVTGKTIPLDDALRNHIEGIDFSMFGYVPPLQLIKIHQETPYYVMRFGAPLPSRPPAPLPPDEIAGIETRYVEQLLEAYGDNRKVNFNSRDELDEPLTRHFKRARESFYCAEELRNFSRDSLPENVFKDLQEQIFDGVVDLCESQHPCGLTRLNETTALASTLNPMSSALVGRTNIADKKGICHQLANEDRLVWVLK